RHRVGRVRTQKKRPLPRLPSRRYGFYVPTFTKIVAATDFSEDSNLALGYAQELALKFSSDIVLLHVDQPLAPVMMSSVAERVVQKAPCPVLTIRPPDRKFKHPLEK